jgi:hypothetical protein
LFWLRLNRLWRGRWWGRRLRRQYNFHDTCWRHGLHEFLSITGEDHPPQKDVKCHYKDDTRHVLFGVALTLRPTRHDNHSFSFRLGRAHEIFSNLCCLQSGLRLLD